MITIDFDKTYDILKSGIDRNISLLEFSSPQHNSAPEIIRVIMQPHSDPLLRNVYNLAMGPPIGELEVDDNIRLRHTNSGKVFSTAILFALTFLIECPEMTIGLDGTDDIRAILYHSMFKANKKTLNDYFDTIGVDWYVKLLRNQIEIERTHDGAPFLNPGQSALIMIATGMTFIATICLN